MSRFEEWTIHEVLEQIENVLLYRGDYPLLVARLQKARSKIQNWKLTDGEGVPAVIVDEKKFMRFLYPLIALVFGAFIALIVGNPFRAEPATYRVILMDSGFPPRAIVQWTTDERPTADGCFLTWEDSQGREVRVSGTIITEQIPRVAAVQAPPPAQPAAAPDRTEEIEEPAQDTIP